MEMRFEGRNSDGLESYANHVNVSNLLNATGWSGGFTVSVCAKQLVLRLALAGHSTTMSFYHFGRERESRIEDVTLLFRRNPERELHQRQLERKKT